MEHAIASLLGIRFALSDVLLTNFSIVTPKAVQFSNHNVCLMLGFPFPGKKKIKNLYFSDYQIRLSMTPISSNSSLVLQMN